jgi:dienelactone hydrolase
MIRIADNDFKAPLYRLVKKEKGWIIIFEGPVFEGQTREVFAYYANPGILNNDWNIEKKYPAVILVHGGGGRAFQEWVEKWASRGYSALALDLSARDGLKHFHKPPGPPANMNYKFYNIDNGLNKMWETFSLQAIIKAHSLLLSLPYTDKSRTAIKGISWGGYLTCIAAAFDHRFSAAATVYGCGFWDELSGPAEYFSNMPEKNIKSWLNHLDPKHYLPEVKCPIMFINGNRDFFFDLLPFYKSYRLVPESFRKVLIIPDLPHNHHTAWNLKEVNHFFDHILQSAASLPEINSIKFGDERIAAYCSNFSIPGSAFLYYTKDFDNTNPDRIWYHIPGKIKDKNLVFTNPGNEMEYGFIYLKDENHLSVSSELLINNKTNINHIS